MRGYGLHYPRWLALLQYLLFVVFMGFFMYTVIQKGDLKFIILSAVFFVVGLVIYLYVLVTGKHPVSVRKR